MNILLIFFALPIATIIISIALQKIFKCPILVASIIFAIFLIVTFVIGSLEFLIAAIIYTIISYITAVIVCILNRFFDRIRNNCDYTVCNYNRENQDNFNHFHGKPIFQRTCIFLLLLFLLFSLCSVFTHTFFSFV